jgi:Prealbumin-like fold domain
MMKLSRSLAVIALVAGSIAPAIAQQSTSPRLEVRTVAPRNPGIARAHGLAMIQGNALTATNAELPNVPVRLRDARFGNIVARQITDKSGTFVFRDLDPGTYIVEMLDADDSVVAASQILNINGGEALSAIVKLPLRPSAFSSLLGPSAVTTAAAVTTEAAASSILTVQTTGTPACPTAK